MRQTLQSLYANRYLRGDDVVACVSNRREGQKLSSLAGGGRDGSNTALEGRHPFLEHVLTWPESRHEMAVK